MVHSPCGPAHPLRTLICCSVCRFLCLEAASTDSGTEDTKVKWASLNKLPFILNWSQSCTDQVVSEGLLVLHVFKTVLADPQLGLLSVVFRKRREVPGVDLKVPYLDLVYILHFGDLGETYKVAQRWNYFQILCNTFKKLHGNWIMKRTQQERLDTQTVHLTASCSFSRAAVVGSISA